MKCFSRFHFLFTVAFMEHANCLKVSEAGTLVFYSAGLKLFVFSSILVTQSTGAPNSLSPPVRGFSGGRRFHLSCTQSEIPPSLRQAGFLV